MGLHVIQPFVPAPDREPVVNADLGFRLLALLGHGLIDRVVGGAAMHGGLEENRFAVRSPLGRSGSERKLSQAARLPAADGDDINLADLVTVAFGTEGDLGAVWTPGRAGLLPFCGRQAARGLAAIAR